MLPKLRPFYEQVRAHYDLSNDFYRLWLDPTLTYSCAVFERPDMSLKEAQLAKLDRCLRKADVQPGHRLLEVGFGWGSCLRRAAERYGADVVGLTLSEAQHRYVERWLAQDPPRRGKIEIRLQGWEEFEEPVDRIVSIEVFEHFRKERYSAFFERCRGLLPAGGRMLLQTSLRYNAPTLDQRGIELTHEDVLFAKFIGKHIFPGGELCEPDEVLEHAQPQGFRVVHSESLRQHYPRTLDHWAANLQAHRDRAVELTSQETYDRYMKYLTGCSRRFASGHIDVMQFTMLAE